MECEKCGLVPLLDRGRSQFGPAVEGPRDLDLFHIARVLEPTSRIHEGSGVISNIRVELVLEENRRQQQVGPKQARLVSVRTLGAKTQAAAVFNRKKENRPTG